MPTNFPGGQDSFPTAADLADDTFATKPHSTLHGNLGDAVAAIEAHILGVYAQRASYSGVDVSIPQGVGSPTNLSWDSLDAGVALLDLTDPIEPTVLVGGIYSVTVVVYDSTAITAGGGLLAVLHLDQLGLDAVCEATYGAGSRADGRYLTSLNNTYYIPAGGQIALGIVNTDGVVDHDVRIREACIQRVL